MKKTLKLFLSLLIMTVVFLGLKGTVSAEDIEVYSKEYLQGIRSLDASIDTRFHFLTTTDGEIVFCVKSNAEPPEEVTKYYYLTSSAAIKAKAPGIIAIINDSKDSSIMKDNSGNVLPARENYYVTQFAVWYYIEGYSGLMTNNGIKWIQGSRYGNAFNRLMSDAQNAVAKNPRMTVTSESGGALSNGMYAKEGTTVMLSNTNFGVSFTETSNDNQDFTVVLPNSDGVKSYLTNKDGSINYGSEHTFSAGERFRIAIDTSYVTTETAINVKFTVSGTNNESTQDLNVYTAYDSGYGFQDVALVRSNNVPLSVDYAVNTKVEKVNSEIEINKVNSDNKKIAGAVIGVFNADGTKVTEITSKGEGTANDKVSLGVGNYYIQEISAPKGYLINSTKVEFSINEKGELVGSDKNIVNSKSLTLVNTLPTIEIEKVNEKQIPVKGAELVICDYDMDTKKESNCDYKWTSDGTVKKLTIGVDFGTIKDGSYIIKELSAPHGFEISDPKYITVKDGKLYGDVKGNKITIIDVTYLDVSKTDATGQKEIEGASMKLFDKKGNLIEAWTSTTEEHRIKGLEIGEVYEIVEELAPEGYVPLSTSIKFRLTNEGKAETLDCASVSGNGSGIDTSSCKVMSSEDVLKIKNEVTKIKISKVDVTNQEELPGATLRILTEDGKPVYQNGKILEWVSTNEPHYIEMLPVGKYKLVETVVPEGYAAVTNEVSFEVKAETGIQAVKFENDVTKVLISKKDFTTGEEIEGATLQILNEDGTPVYQNGEELKWVSGKEPHYIEKLPVGKYILVETLPADGYKNDMIVDGMLTSKYEFEVKDNMLLKIDVYNEVITDVPITGMDVSSTYVLGGMAILLGIGTITFSKKKNEI